MAGANFGPPLPRVMAKMASRGLGNVEAPMAANLVKAATGFT